MTAYLAHEVGRLAGVPGDRIGQWARWGHIRASVSQGDPHIYGWEDAAEAVGVHDLLERGLRLPAIRAAVDRLGGSAAHPLSTVPLHVVDGRLAVEREDGLADVLSGQGVLPLDGRVDPLGLLRRGGWPARMLDDLRHVEVDPERLGGRPCVRGRRIAVEDVAALAAEPLGPALLAEDFGLDGEQIDDAVRWWAEAQRYGEAA